MEPNELTHSAEALKSICQSQERLYTFLQLYKRHSPKQISKDLDLTRSALQFYLDDWKEHDLIYTDGNDYLFTDKGEKTQEYLHGLHQYLETAENTDGAEKHSLQVGEQVNAEVLEVFAKNTVLQPENTEYQTDIYLLLDQQSDNANRYSEGDKLKVQIVDFHKGGVVQVKAVEEKPGDAEADNGSLQKKK